MATTLSTTSSFGTSIPDAYFRKELLNFGEYALLHRRFASKEKLPPGNGKVWKANRYLRVELPMESLSEGITPTDVQLSIEQISLTAAQYGIVVTLSDVIQLTLNSPVLQKAIELVRDVMERLDNELICEALLTNTNVVYPTGTTRAGLAATNVLDTPTIKKALAQLEFPSDTWGSAPRYAGGNYVCILFRKHELDLLNDTTWKDMAIRQSKEDLEKGMVNRWMGVEFYVTNFGPKFENLGTTNAVGAANSKIEDSVTAVNDGGAAFSTATYNFQWTRRHKHRRFEEGISGTIGVAMTATHSAKFSAATNTAYVYTLYIEDGNGGQDGTQRRSSAVRVAASSVTDGLGVPAAAAAAVPATTAASVNVYASWVFGREAYAVVDLDNMEAGVSEPVRSDSDPLKQRRKVGAKFYEGALILSDNNIVRMEAASAF